MNTIDTARDALRARGAMVLEAVGLNVNVVDAMRSPGGLTSAAEGSESIIGLRAGSPGRRVAGSPGRRVAGSPGRRVAGSPNLRPRDGHERVRMAAAPLPSVLPA